MAVATGVLALAALRALRQLRELRRDRHVQILAELARRWEGPEMTEAFQKSRDYSPQQLANLVAAARSGPMGDPERAKAEKKLLVLLRVPNYFEDTHLISNVGKLERKLLADYFAGVAYDEWSLWRPAVKKLREKDPEYYTGFSDLARVEARALEKRETGYRPPLLLRPPDALLDRIIEWIIARW